MDCQKKKKLKYMLCGYLKIDCSTNRPIADDIRSLVATSFAYKIISASITDIWAF